MITEEEIKYSIKVLKEFLSCFKKDSEGAILAQNTIYNLQTKSLNCSSDYVSSVIKEMLEKKYINKGTKLGKLAEEAIFYLGTKPYGVK